MLYRFEPGQADGELKIENETCEIQINPATETPPLSNLLTGRKPISTLFFIYAVGSFLSASPKNRRPMMLAFGTGSNFDTGVTLPDGRPG